MKITDALVLTGLLFLIAADPKAGVGAQSVPPAVAAGSAGALKPRVAPVCPTGAAQDPQCLEAAGALGADGSISVKKAKALLQSGTCPCVARSGTATGTIPPT